MKTSKFAITLIAFFATNAHAYLPSEPEANKMEEAQLCRAEATQRVLIASDEITYTMKSRSPLAEKAEKYKELGAYKTAAEADMNYWQRKFDDARRQGMIVNSFQNKLDLIHHNGISKKFVEVFYQDCQNAK
jgi:murein L,D-transpeptidase YcbB/YkuD